MMVNRMLVIRPSEGGGGSEGAAPWAHEFRGPTSQTSKKKTRVYLEQGKQNKMCAFVNM